MAINIPIITEFNGKGIERARKEFDQLEGAGAKAGFVLKKAFLPATAALGGLAAAAFDSAKAAMEDEAQQKLLASQLRKTTGATDKQIEATEDYISKQLSLKGFTDSQLRPAFEKLARATGDLTEAQKLTNTAMDIATATGKPLETVVASLEKAYGGNMAAIQRLLPEYRDMIKEGATFDEVMAKVNGTLGGAAAEAATTAEARFRILKEQMGEVQEEIGNAFIPILEKLLPHLQNLANWAQDNPEAFRNIGLAIGGIAAATVALNVAMAANPYVLAAAGIVGMAIAFDRMYNAVSNINKIGGLAARVLGAVFGGPAGAISSLLKISDSIYGAILPGSNSPSGSSGLRGDLMKELKGIPAMAAGGIVTGPTLALIGEAGPEAVIPLDRAGGMGGNNVTINVQGADPNAVVDALRTYMFRNGSVPIRVS
jgi:hypothetical protein